MKVVITSILLVAALIQLSVAAYTTTVTKAPRPALSQANPVGKGHSPCVNTFNPGWIPNQHNESEALVIVRVSGCPADFGGVIT